MSCVTRAAAALACLLVLAACRPAAGTVTPALDPAERAWLDANAARVTVAIETGYAPFVFVGEDGRAHGLAQDYLELIESKLGVRFARVTVPTLSAILDKARAGEVQVVNAVTATAARAEYLDFTEAVISVPNVIITRADRPGGLDESGLAGLRLALVKSYAVTDYLFALSAGFEPLLAPDDLEALLAVAFGRADAAVIDLATASHLIATRKIPDLRVAGEVGFRTRLAIGTAKAEPVLGAVMGKALAAINPAERAELEARWIAPPGNPDPTATLVLGAALAASVLAAAGIVLFLVRAIRRERSIRELRASQKLLQDIIDSSSSFIYLADTDGRLLLLNRSMAEALGGSPAALVGSRREDLLPAETAATHRHNDRQVIETGTPLEFEETARWPGGERVYLTRKFPLLDEAGRVYAVCGISDDFTARKEAERALERASRDNALLLHELRHRVKNSFALICGLVAATAAGAPEPAAREALGEIDARVRSIAELYTLLYESGAYTEVRLDEYCARVLRSLLSAHGGVALNISSLPVTVPAAVAVPVGIIITELATNALKYAFPAGGGSLRLAVSTADGLAQVELSDDGVGMPAGFDAARGGGVGLNLARELAGQIGCQLELVVPASGQSGSGTAWRLRIPATATT